MQETSSDHPVVTVLQMMPKDGRLEDLIRVFAEHRVGQAAIREADCLSMQVLRPVLDKAPILVVATWRSVDDSLRWNASPVRQALGEHLGPLAEAQLGPEYVAAVYDRVLLVEPERG